MKIQYSKVEIIFNKWKLKVNITKWHNGPNSFSKAKQNQALSSDIASKLGPTLPDFGLIIILATFF